jgi:hypothetical protein
MIQSCAMVVPPKLEQKALFLSNAIVAQRRKKVNKNRRK